MSQTIWYISKYITPPYAAKVGARGFLLLREFARKGNCATLITSDSNHLAEPPSFEGRIYREKVDGVGVIWLKTKKYRGARSVGRMWSWLDFEWQLFRLPLKNMDKPDVVIVSSLSLLTILNGLRLKRYYGCKLIFEVRDIWPAVLVVTGKISQYNPFVKFLEWVERLGYNKSDLIVGTMPNLSAHVRQVTGKNLKVVCVPQGIDESLLEPPVPLEDGYLRQYFPKGKFIICHAGSIGADNALETFLACARKMQDRADIQFLIVGDGYLKQYYVDQTRDLRNLVFAPRVHKRAVQSVLNQVDVVYFAVHKSPLWEFGQSLNKIIDYMLSGKPIIASYSGFPSMVNEADCGVYVPAADVDALQKEIKRLAAMPIEARREMGARGRDWVLKHRQYGVLADDYLEQLSFK